MSTIHQEININSPVEKVYSALTQSEIFAGFTGQPADISADAGGEFSGFDGMITGRQVELIPNERIVQAWRVGLWPDGVFSIVRFELKPTADGTQIIFDHTGFPQEEHDHLESGWNKMYWEPLRKFLAA